MRYSKMFGKTVRNAPRGHKLISHQLLHQGGFVRESTAGRHYFLPLGIRVRDKIAKIIEEEMDKAGAQKMITPVLHPLELWQETHRTKTTGFELMKVKDRRGASFALGGTAEEMFVEIVRQFKLSYKDLPFNVYQFSTKFRDELRARGGLLRVREFIMKDAYSFHVDEKDFDKEYANMASTYTKIFKRMELKTTKVAADNGYIGGDYCHEFVVDCQAGESKYFVAGELAKHEDVASFKHTKMNPEEKVKEFKIIEQPKWVKTMQDNVKYYKKPLWRYLKNVVYKNQNTGKVIIAVIRGDLDVNKIKLEQALNLVGQLVEAEDKDLKKIGTKPGYVHCWGHEKARYIGDKSLETVKNFIGGQKEDKTDSKNVNYGRDFKCEQLVDMAMAKEGFVAENGKSYKEKKGIEVGNIFQLGYYYSDKMKNATFIAKDGKQQKYYMGCYGIGLGRTLATIAEMNHDEKGIIWPEVVAPYKVHLISLVGGEEKSEKLYNKLIERGVEILWDDRDVSAGVKLQDADLIGIPYRLVVSKKTGDKVEWKKRNSQKTELLSVEEVCTRLKARQGV